MFPVIRSHAIRGTREIPQVVNLKRVESIALPSAQAAFLLAACDGRTHISDIAAQFCISSESVSGFFQKMADIGVIEWLGYPNEAAVPVSISLGPREPWLSEVHLDITDRCNLAKYCPHCYRGETLNQKSERSVGDWKNVIRSLAKMGVYRIALSGGEPFLRKDLPDIVQCAIDEGLLVSGIFTNGTIDVKKSDRTLKILADQGIQTAIYVSMDGPYAVINDIYRGKGSFEKTVRFVQYIRDQYKGSSLGVSVNSQVNVHNIGLLLSWYDALKKLGIVVWRMNGGRIVGRLAEHKELIVSQKQLSEAYQSLIERHIVDWKNSALPFKLNIEGFFRTNMLLHSRAYIFDEHLPICDYKKKACSVEPNGNISFCTSWGFQSFGNVFEEGIEDIWYNSGLQKLKSMLVGDITECRDCELLRFCGGGCRLVAETVTSRDFASCEKYRLFSEHIVPILEREGVSFTL